MLRINYRKLVFSSLLLTGIVSVMLCLSCIVFTAQRVRNLFVEYSTKPPEKVYRLALHSSPPRGTSNFQIAGHGAGMGHMVWMKFRATDAAFATLKKDKRLALGEPGREFIRINPQLIRSNPAALAIGWQNILKPNHKEIYSFNHAPGGSGWVGEIVFDRKNHTAYVYATVL